MTAADGPPPGPAAAHRGSPPHPSDLHRPVALVTGAARGIGAATVRALAAAGWSVVATDRCADDPALDYPLGTRAELEAVVAEACTLAAARGVVADTRDARALADAVLVAESAFGGLDAVVAVAGAMAGGTPLWATPPDQVDVLLGVNLAGVVTVARAALPAILRRPVPRHGRFVAVASAAATRGMPGLAAYSAAKAGVTGLVRGLAADLRGTGVTANAVSPGSTDTAMLARTARLYGLPGPQEFAAQQPLERLLRPDEVAAAICWLLSRHADGVTGVVLPVDGGLSL